MPVIVRAVLTLALAIPLVACASDPRPEAEPAPGPTDSAADTSPSESAESAESAEPSEESEEPSASATPSPSEPARSEPPAPPARPVSVLGLAEQRHRGDRLRLGPVREQAADYTSYDVTFRSRSTGRGLDGQEESLIISGVLNVPTGRGPFPAVVLAHGYIDPAYYVRGQGMTRERGFLASRGYVALHVDYRSHAESDDDPRSQERMRLGYSADVVNAVKALRRTRDVPVDDDRIALFGRSMGGGVVLKALVAEPGLVGAATTWASVSSLEAENYDQFVRPDRGGDDEVARRWGLPEDNPRHWRENSSRPYLGRITEPVLLVHGRYDDTCPPPWAVATKRRFDRVGGDASLVWYDDGHAFGPAFTAAMDRTVRFFDTRLDQ